MENSVASFDERDLLVSGARALRLVSVLIVRYSLVLRLCSARRCQTSEMEGLPFREIIRNSRAAKVEGGQFASRF